MDKKEFTNNTRDEALACIRNPFGGTMFNNRKQLLRTLNYSNIPIAEKPTRDIVEGRYLFFGASAIIARREAINGFEALAKSDYMPVQLYLPKEDNSFDSPDNVSSSLKFTGPVVRM